MKYPIDRKHLKKALDKKSIADKLLFKKRKKKANMPKMGGENEPFKAHRVKPVINKKCMKKVKKASNKVNSKKTV